MLSVIVIDNGIEFQLRRTVDSLSKQSDSKFSYRIVDMPEFWKSDRNTMVSDDGYTMFVYSGSVLMQNAVKFINNALEKNDVKWIYCDELAEDAGLEKRFLFVREKPEYSIDSFLDDEYLNEGMIFSNKELKNLDLEYEGTNFGVALQEITVKMALLYKGFHLDELLLNHYGRGELSGEEKQLIELWRKELKDSKNDGWIGYDNPSYEIVCVKNEDSLLESVHSTLDTINSDVLVFANSNCDFSDKDIVGLVQYALQKDIGLVSPRVMSGNMIVYSGVFSTFAMPFAYSDSDDMFELLRHTIERTRSVSIPAWQFFVIEKNKLLDIDWNELDKIKTFLPEYIVFCLSEILREKGLDTLYVCDTCVEWSGSKCFGESTGFDYMLNNYGKRFVVDEYCPVTAKAFLRCNSISDVKCYMPENPQLYSKDKKKIFVISHELSLTGAPIVLVHAVHILQEYGYQLIVVSPKDGEIREEFLALGIPVIIMGNMMSASDDWLGIAKAFDIIIVNTVGLYKQIEQLGKTDIPVLWWLHDARFGYEKFMKYFLPQTVADNIHIYSVSKYAEDVVKSFRPLYTSNVLPYGIEDVSNSTVDNTLTYIDKNRGIKTFVSVGQILYRKGQDILAEAIRLLDNETRNQCEFLIIGKKVDLDIYESLEKIKDEFPKQVKLIDSIPHEKIMSLYRDADAVICPSRDDPLPTYMTETMMLSGVCICSENTGTAPYIVDGENGFVYRDDSPLELSNCIRKVVDSVDLGSVRNQSRKTYEEYFSMDIFKTNINKAIKECLNEA